MLLNFYGLVPESQLSMLYPIFCHICKEVELTKSKKAMGQQAKQLVILFVGELLFQRLTSHSSRIRLKGTRYICHRLFPRSGFFHHAAFFVW